VERALEDDDRHGEPDERLERLAEDVGADPCRVLSDATYSTYEPVLQANREEGTERDIPGTPAVFVNGALTPASYTEITSAIESTR